MKNSNLYSLSEAQVLKTNSDLKQIITSHIVLGNSVMEALFYDDLIYTEKFRLSISNPHTCKLGKWLIDINATNLLTKDEFVSINNTHANYHFLIDELLKKMSGNSKPEFACLKQISTIQNTITEFLLDISNTLLTAQFQFDQLTTAINRGTLEVILKKEISEISRDIKSSSCVVFVDIDKFKNINDAHGHASGDIVLKEVVALFKKHTRSYDIIARWGGEEFIILLPNTDLQAAFDTTERIRMAIKEHPFLIQNDDVINLTCSFGISSILADDSVESVVSRADDLLYFAKESGRDQVRISKDQH
jgi:diguanylate cyclase (GGDEF)-like protein